MGSVGEAAVQIARNLGARVSGACGETDMARARALGVEQVHNYRRTDLSQLGERYDAVFDAAASMDSATGFTLLKPAGVLLDLHPAPLKFLRALFNRILAGSATAAEVAPWRRRAPAAAPNHKPSSRSAFRWAMSALSAALTGRASRKARAPSRLWYG